MIHFDVAKWYLENLTPVIAVPIWLIDLEPKPQGQSMHPSVVLQAYVRSF